MTNKEAIEILTAKAECIRREVSGTDFACNLRNCDECDLCYAQGTTGEQREALGMAIKAIEKQIPKRPNNCIWYGDGSAMGHCPMCDTFLDSDSDAYCGGCGQAIDWTEDE